MKEFNMNQSAKIKSGFTTPPAYFETLESKIWSQIDQNQHVISLYEKKMVAKTWFFKIAAMLVVSISVLFFVNQFTENKNRVALENYLTQHSAISDDDVVDLMDAESIDKIQFDIKLQQVDVEQTLTNNPDLEQIITN